MSDGCVGIYVKGAGSEDMPPRSSCAALKKGDHLYEVSYYVVDAMDAESVHARNTITGDKLSISRTLVENTIYSTGQFAREEQLTRSQLAQKIETLGHSSFRVKFRKQVQSNDVADSLDGADLGTQAKRRKLVKTLMEGEERVMNARLVRSDEFDASMEFGRYKVIDLDDLEKTHNEKRSTRLVDTRTVSDLIVDNVRYYV